MKITINHQTYTPEQILTMNADGITDESLLLIHQWLMGQQLFTFKTSGSTGTPKLIQITRSQIEASAQGTIKAMAYTSRDHFFCALSTQTIAGAMLVFRAMIVGADLTVINAQSDPLKVIDEQHSFTTTSFVPMQLFQVENDDIKKGKLNGFKTILLGGSKVSTHLESWLSHQLPKVYETYGMTETVSHIALKEIGKSTAFKVLPGIEIRKDERGCLEIKGDVTLNKWITTNDIVQLSDANQFIVEGRIDHIINTGGVKVQTEKIEGVISAKLLNRQVMIIGLPHDRFGEQVTLIIEGEANITLDEIKQIIKDDLSIYEIPKALFFIDEFKKTTSGKVDKMFVIGQLDSSKK